MQEMLSTVDLFHQKTSEWTEELINVLLEEAPIKSCRGGIICSLLRLDKVKYGDWDATMFSFNWMDKLANWFIVSDALYCFSARGLDLHSASIHTALDFVQSYFQNTTLRHKMARKLIEIERKRYDPGILAERKDLQQYVLSGVLEFMQDVRELYSSNEDSHFSYVALMKAIKNVIGMRLLAWGTGNSDCPRKAVSALALLHPLADDLFDQQEVTQETLNLLRAKLQANHVVSPRNRGEALSFALVNDLFRCYPAETHPVFASIMQELLKQQIRSIKQTKSEDILSARELADISIRKGALALVAAHYVASGRFPISSGKYIWQLGGLMQLLDDLSDIGEDMESNLQTLWTQAINRRESIDDVAWNLIHAIRHIREEGCGYSVDLFTHLEVVTGLDEALKVEFTKSFFKYSPMFSKRFQCMVRARAPLQYKRLVWLISRFPFSHVIEHSMNNVNCAQCLVSAKKLIEIVSQSTL